MKVVKPIALSRLTLHRRRFARELATASLGLAVGCTSNPNATAPRPFQVSGPSMNPSFWGRHVRMSCDACRIETRVDEKFVKRAERFVCWHCGTACDWPDTPANWLPPDLVSPEPIQRPPRRGEVVLVQADGGLHLKRIVGTPGQTLAATEDLSSQPRSSVQRDALEAIDAIEWPRVPVDFDDHRPTNQSRWSRVTVGQRSGWAYRHRNVYRGDRSTPILNDMPGNVGLSGPLPRAVVVGVDVTVDRGTPTRVLFHLDERPASQIVGQVLHQDESTTRLRFCSNQATATKEPFEIRPDATVTPPVVILHDDRPTAIEVWRRVAYRYDGPTVELADDQWFVMGDNIALSIDSRRWGPIRTSQIVASLIEAPHNLRRP